jgi:hypothetical protein
LTDTDAHATASTFGILTIAFGLFASLLIFISIIRDANSEIYSLLQFVTETKSHIEGMRGYIR